MLVLDMGYLFSADKLAFGLHLHSVELAGRVGRELNQLDVTIGPSAE
jgi:hypothetical protein